MGIKKNIENNIADLTAKMESLGIYRPEYDIAIRNLAENMEARNQAWKRYMSGDGTLKDYRDLAASRARLYLNERIDADAALKCAIALKKRDFAMDVLLDRIEANAVKGW